MINLTESYKSKKIIILPLNRMILTWTFPTVALYEYCRRTKYHPYKEKSLQEFDEDDNDRSFKFRETARLFENPHFVKNIIFR